MDTENVSQWTTAYDPARRTFYDTTLYVEFPRKPFREQQFDAMRHVAPAKPLFHTMK